MYTNSNRTAFVETKGYYNNVLQWETGQITIDKTTFTQNPYNYSGNTNWVNTVLGSQDFAGQLDKVYINIGGYGTYYWDEFQYNIAYNYITTVIETWMQVVEQQQNLDTMMDLMDNYEIMDTFEQNIMDTTMEDMVNMEVDIPDVDIPDVDLPTTEVSSSEEMLQDLEIDMPMMDVEEVAAEIEEMVAEIEDIGETPSEEATSSPIDEPESTEEAEEQQVEETDVAKNKVEDSKTKTDTKKEVAADEKKPSKQQEKKQQKAKEIIESFASNYDPVAQITTLALVNALGPNITTYSNQVIQPALEWYKTEEIYKNVVMDDPLGNYISVKDSLIFNKMIEQQYE
jgi:hypothetical protein